MITTQQRFRMRVNVPTGANPAVVTSTAHPFTDGDIVRVNLLQQRQQTWYLTDGRAICNYKRNG